MSGSDTSFANLGSNLGLIIVCPTWSRVSPLASFLTVRIGAGEAGALAGRSEPHRSGGGRFQQSRVRQPTEALRTADGRTLGHHEPAIAAPFA